MKTKRLARLALAVVLSWAPAVACKQDRSSVGSPHLSVAIEAGRWLQSGTRSAGGRGLPDEIAAGAPASLSLGSGAAGRLVFFLELFAATGDESFLESARIEGETIESRQPTETSAPGLYDGLAGEAFALTELAKAADSSSVRRQAEERFAVLIRQARWTGDAAVWNTSNDVLTGTAGIGLACLYAARELGGQEFLRLARGAGRALLASGVRSSTGTRWSRWSDRDLNLPNFSHGTAGVAYFLAELSEATGDHEFLAAAESGAAYLGSIADRTDGLFLVPYGIPDDGYPTAYDIGWAHGPAGTGRLFYRLWQLTKNDAYRAAAQASALSILAAGVPGPTTNPARWSGPFALDRRFGLAGVVPFLADWYRISGDERFLSTAGEIAGRVAERSVSDGPGRFWRLPRYEFQAGEGEGVFTGYFYGAAGLGLALLEAHFAATGAEPGLRLPDDPFR